MRTIMLVLLLLAMGSPALAETGLPDAKLTPGVCKPLSTEVICKTKWGKDHRAVTAAMKRKVFLSYGFQNGNADPRCRNPNSKTQKCEIDHLCSREVGGDDVIPNLWPQPYAGPCNAHDKDRLENALHRKVCAVPQEISLEQAQSVLVTNWKDAFRAYVDPKGCE